MHRRTLLTAATAAALARPAIGRGAAARTLKFVPYTDLVLLDPLVSSFVVRNHCLMVFDTLYGLDINGKPQPQMAAGHVVEDDGKTWRITLRDGLRFHDNTPVLARDVVASLRRWATRDTQATLLFGATDALDAPSDREVRFRLNRPYPLLTQALAKPTNPMAVVMPERLATRPSNVLLQEIVGSGPYRFMADQRVPGARNVYRRFEGYVPRPSGTPSLTSGPRIAQFDEVQWLTTPDPATQAAALQAGEVDWVEQPLMDLVPQLKRDAKLRVEVIETAGLIGWLRFNHLHPPFDNPAIRRAVLAAIDQRTFMQAVVGDNAAFDARVGVYAPKTPMATDAGIDAAYGPPKDIKALQQVIKNAGYKGEPVVSLTATDVPRINAINTLGADTLRKLGFNVNEVHTDYGTVIQRSVKKEPVEQGGWNMFGLFSSGWDWISPVLNQQLRGDGLAAYSGWPTSQAMEALRHAWTEAPDETTRKDIATKRQLQAWQDVPIMPVGAYFQPSAFSKSLTGILPGLTQFTNVQRA
jgi:peptide/nickel transport system substrate-binding protein